MENKEYYAVLKIKAPQKYKETVYYNYIVAKCKLIKTVNSPQQEFEVVFNIDENLNQVEPVFDKNGKCTNSIIVSNIYQSHYSCKKQADTLNDEMIREAIKQASLYDAREVSKVLRENLNYAQTLESKIIYESNNSRDC